MEPVAPGTEEDVQQGSSVSKKTAEQARLLSIKAYLPNCEYDNVFELSYNNGSEHWYCKICRCPIMGRVFYHEIGKRHSTNMESAGEFADKRDPKIESTGGSETEGGLNNIKVAPGEPVPPGFEGEITKVAQIQDRLDAFRSGSLLGLEYLLEIQDYDHEKEPSYLCLLCGKKGDPRTVIAHLVSYNHLQSYLQRHFPVTYKALAPYVTRRYKKNWQDTMNKIGESIETKYGRLLPHPVDAETFDKKKEELYQMVHLGAHFSEKNGVTFEHLISQEEMTKVTDDDGGNKSDPPPISEVTTKRSPSPPIVLKPRKPRPSGLIGRRRSLSSVSTISSSDLSDFEDKKKEVKKEKPALKPRQPYETRKRTRSRSPVVRKVRYELTSPSPAARRGGGIRRDMSMPWNRPDYVRSRSDMPPDSKSRVRDEKQSEFKKLSAAIESDMEKGLKQHKLNPEKHPQYNEEWKIFWNKRYKELQAEGKDASKHDFKPEWILYWNEKIVELHEGEVKVKIEALRKRLGIAEPTPISFKIGGRKKGSYDSKVPPMASQPDNDHEIIIIDDKDDDSRSPRRSHSPWETESASRSRKSTDRRLSLERVSSSERDMKPSNSKPKARERDRYTRPTKEKSRSSNNKDRRDYRSNDRDYRSREKSWDRDIMYRRESRKDPILAMYKPPAVMRDVTRKPVHYGRSPPSPEMMEDDGDVNIVGVLRLLTALEDKLGSLGPKVIDMLGTALALEKKEANSSETLLDNEINCVLFETIKEKLKGALHAGLVDYNQEKAFKGAITKIAGLIHLAGTRKTDMEALKAKVDPVKVPGVGTVDKTAIAKQIATALILQGKTDVTQGELEQLINAVVGMAEASKNSDKPITTASFLESWNRGIVKEEPKVVEVKVVAETSQVVTPTPVETPPNNKDKDNKDNMEGLSDSDLQTLLQNFKDLSTEEQHGLITYLKKLEAGEPERVEKLRKFVNLGPEELSRDDSGRVSPFTRKLNNVDKEKENTPMENEFEDFDDDMLSDHEEKVEEKKQVERPIEKVKIDSDDEDYSYEDVFKAASKNVEANKLVKDMKIVEDSIKRDADVLTDAKALIANIMGSIASKSSPRIDSPQVQPAVMEEQSNSFANNRPSSIPPGQTLQLGPSKASLMHASPSAGGSQPGMFNAPGTSVQPQQPGFNGPARAAAPFVNQPVQYPIKNPNNPYAGNFQQGYGNNYNFSNQFKQNTRFNPIRGQFHNKSNYNNRGDYNNFSNRGDGNFNNRSDGNFNNRW